MTVKSKAEILISVAEEKSLPKPETDLPSPEKKLNTGKAEKKGFPKILVFFIALGIFGIVAFIAIIISMIALTFKSYNFLTSEGFLTKTGPTTFVQSTPAPEQNIADWETYNNSGGKYSIKYPSDYELKIDEVAGVDGVLSPTPNTIQLISSTLPNTNGNFALRVNHSPTTLSLNNFIDKNSPCDSVSSEKGNPYVIDDIQALIFKDTPCGAWGSTFIYAVNNGIGYIIKIEDTADSSIVEKYYNQILSSFKFTDSEPTCIPRPSCLDANPACKIPETDDMCPPSPAP